jgi:hypothetical protein
MGNKAFFFIVIILAISEAHGQFVLPRIDIEAKVAQGVIPSNNNDNVLYTLKAIETTNLQLGIHWQLTQHIAVGWIYSNSMRGGGYNSENFKFNFGKGDSKAFTSFNVFDLRLSAGRATKWRPYLSINYGRAEIVEDKGSFRLADKTTAFGGSIGTMRRLGNHLYWNVIEIGAKTFSDKLFWADTGNLMIEAKMGFTYNIGKKK